MRRKRFVISCIVAVMLATALSGCGDKVKTDEQIVMKKDESNGEDSAKKQDTLLLEGQNGQEASQGAGNEGKGAIAQQVQAPEHFTTEAWAGCVHLKADAEMIIPNAEGFKSYKVTSRTFEQSDYVGVSKVLLHGEKLWNREYDAMEKADDVVKSEIEESEELFGYATLEGVDYTVNLDNAQPLSDWIYAYFQIQRKSGGYYGSCAYDDLTEQEKELIKFSEEEIKEKAKGQMQAMGFSDFDASGEEYYAFFDAGNRQEDIDTAEGMGYIIRFTRILDGIPVTYTDEDGGAVEENSIAWNYEKIELAYDENGLIRFEWVNPYVVEKLSDEFLFLLPFSEIQTVFENLIMKKYEDAYSFEEDGIAQLDVAIKEVRLGYMRVREAGDATEGTMVPVWDFFGTTMITETNGEHHEGGGTYTSLLTINALDGSVIDRGLGY